MSKAEYEQICLELDNTRQKDHPHAYDMLSQAEKEALQYWIEHAIQPATKVDEHQSSYGLKHEYERETKCYVSHAQFKGAMLVAGYLPIRKGEQSWHFTIMPTDDKQHFSYKDVRQNNKGRVRTYRSTPPGEQDLHFNDLVQKAIVSRKGSGIYTVMI